MVFPEGTQKILVGPADPYPPIIRVAPDLRRKLRCSAFYLYPILISYRVLPQLILSFIYTLF